MLGFLKTQCPICGSSFPSNAISQHAATCGEETTAKREMNANWLNNAKKNAKTTGQTLTRQSPSSIDQTTNQDARVCSSSVGQTLLDGNTEGLPVDHNCRDVWDRISSRDSSVQASASSMDRKTSLDEPLINTNQEDDDDEDSPTPRSAAKTTTKSAFDVIMQNANRKPQTFLFDFETKSCKWYAESVPMMDKDWSGVVKLGKDANAPKVRIMGRNLPLTDSPIIRCSPVSSFTVGTLKSIMQKSFRRRNVSACKAAASELAHKSWKDLLRRVPIVILEDGSLHPHFAALVWIMLAESCGLPPSQALAQFIIDVTSEACNTEIADDSYLSISAIEISPEELESLKDENYAALVFSIQARAKFGGMTGDMLMCKRFARLWYTRFIDVKQTNEGYFKAIPQQPPTSSSNAAVLRGFDSFSVIPLASIDYHCQPSLFQPILLRHRIADKAFEQAMWNFRSSINYRVTVRDALMTRIPMHVLFSTCTVPEALLDSRRTLMQEKEKGHDDDVSDQVKSAWCTIASECESASENFVKRTLARY